MKVGAVRDRIGAALGAAGLERLVAGEDVPGGDQDLARDRGLGGLLLPVRCLTSRYRQFQRFVGRHAHWAASIAAHRIALGLGQSAQDRGEPVRDIGVDQRAHVTQDDLAARVASDHRKPQWDVDRRGRVVGEQLRTRRRAMAHEGVPLIVIQRQLGHSNLGITSIYLQGIDNAEIIEAVHARRAPMVPVSTALRR